LYNLIGESFKSTNNNMNYIDKFKDYISEERELLDAVPKDATEEQLDDAQVRLDALRALRLIEDREVAEVFYKEAPMDAARGKLKGRITAKKPYNNSLVQVLGGGWE
jgi:hypothetical protein